MLLRLAAVTLGVLLLGAAPAHAEVDVRMWDNRFAPAATVVGQGEAVEFTNFGRVIHDARDRSGLDAFDTGLVQPPEAAAVGPLPGAGRYRYVCTFHPEMTGRLDVPVTVRRGEGDEVTVRWAARPRAGLVFDVQRRRPGAARFEPWRTGATAAATRWWPSTSGTWELRARVRSASSGEASAWSPPRRVRT